MAFCLASATASRPDSQHSLRSRLRVLATGQFTTNTHFWSKVFLFEPLAEVCNQFARWKSLVKRGYCVVIICATSALASNYDGGCSRTRSHNQPCERPPRAAVRGEKTGAFLVRTCPWSLAPTDSSRSPIRRVDVMGLLKLRRRCQRAQSANNLIESSLT